MIVKYFDDRYELTYRNPVTDDIKTERVSGLELKFIELGRSEIMKKTLLSREEVAVDLDTLAVERMILK